MSAVSMPVGHEAHGEHTMSVGEFVNTYIFSRDHKIIGIQFLFSTLLWFLVGGLFDSAPDQTQRRQRTQRNANWSYLCVLRVLCVDSAPLHQIENRSNFAARSKQRPVL